MLENQQHFKKLSITVWEQMISVYILILSPTTEIITNICNLINKINVCYIYISKIMK